MSYDVYVFLLCLLVFLALTAIFTVATVGMARLTVRLIRHGAEDKKITEEYKKEKARKRKTGAVETVFTAFFCCAVLACFGFSVYVNLTDGTGLNGVGVCKVVKSNSMSEKNPKNRYLFENQLDDQFSAFDLILTYTLPEEKDLQLYDIVVYEVDNILIVHRIVGIEEANAKHPDERYFLLQGDAVGAPDRFPVLYKQMKAVYKGERIPFVGSFILFLQSPAGYLCILLILFATFALPIAEKKIEKEKKKRLALLSNKKNTGVLKNGVPYLPPIVFYPVYYQPTTEKKSSCSKR